jgi:AAA+ ATPase superfamily predicted ATPase
MICVECKWTDLSQNEARVILKNLEEKSQIVRWKNENRKTIYALVGKKIAGKRDIRKSGYEVYDLSDIDRILGYH